MGKEEEDVGVLRDLFLGGFQIVINRVPLRIRKHSEDVVRARGS